MNNFIGIGRLVKDPALRYLQSGTAVTNFTLAIERQMTKEKKDEAKRKGGTTADFVPVTVWGKQAESCANYLTKGRMAAVSGRITTGSYEKDGKTVYTTEVTAERVQFLEWGEKTQSAEATQPKFEATNDPFPF